MVATPSAFTLGLLFHVDNKMGERELCLIYFSAFHMEITLLKLPCHCVIF